MGLYEKGNCCLITALRPKSYLEDRIYLVANTHLNFNSNRGDIKLSEVKLMTDTLAQLKTYYRDIMGLKVATFVCGDFNSTPRGGIYEFMRAGSYDCLKLDRYSISGQKYGTFDIKDESASFLYLSSSMNLSETASFPDKWDDKNFRSMAQWYTEIINTHPILDIDHDLKPTGLHI
jgi:hypothetical protein